MRNIRYRAWDKNAKMMLYVGDNPSWADTTGKLIDSFEDEDLMQYTGLKDKNGKEIFEGDIIKVEPHEGNERLYQIVYSRASFVLKWITPYDDIRISMQDEFEMEIIGNSYENPELLK